MKKFLKKTTQMVFAVLALFCAIGVVMFFYIDSIIDVYDTTTLKLVFFALAIAFSFTAWNTRSENKE